MQSDHSQPPPLFNAPAPRGMRPLRLADVIEAAVRASMHCIAQRHHELQLDLPPEPLMVTGDMDGLTQVFSNLLLNASKFTPDYGHIAISARRRDDIVDVAVRDDGAGVPAALQAHVFDLSARGFRHADLSPGGMGVGLALARAITEMHGGTIELRSAGHRCGSKFTVSLPLLKNSDKPIAAAFKLNCTWGQII